MMLTQTCSFETLLRSPLKVLNMTTWGSLGCAFVDRRSTISPTCCLRVGFCSDGYGYNPQQQAKSIKILEFPETCSLFRFRNPTGHILNSTVQVHCLHCAWPHRDRHVRSPMYNAQFGISCAEILAVDHAKMSHASHEVE